MRQPLWLYLWLLFVLISGVNYSFAVRTSSLLPGSDLLFVGIGIIVIGGMLGNARTGKWSTWDGRVVPNRLEWFLGHTGAVLAVSPFMHVLLLLLMDVARAKSR